MIRNLANAAVVCSLALGMLACGGDTETTEEAPAASTPAPPPASSASKPKAEVHVVIIRPVGDEMKYETTDFTVTAGQPVRLIMDNIATSVAMVHNVVVTRPGTNTDEVGMAAVTAGEAAGYVPKHDAILFYTALAKPGEKTQVEFTAPRSGDYPYLCTFPGHFALMKGVMHSVE